MCNPCGLGPLCLEEANYVERVQVHCTERANPHGQCRPTLCKSKTGRISVERAQQHYEWTRLRPILCVGRTHSLVSRVVECSSMGWAYHVLTGPLSHSVLTGPVCVDWIQSIEQAHFSTLWYGPRGQAESCGTGVRNICADRPTRLTGPTLCGPGPLSSLLSVAL